MCKKGGKPQPALRCDWKPVSRTLVLHLPVVRNKILLIAQYNQMKALRKQLWAAWEPPAETSRICHTPSLHWSLKSLRIYLRRKKRQEKDTATSVWASNLLLIQYYLIWNRSAKQHVLLMETATITAFLIITLLSRIQREWFTYKKEADFDMKIFLLFFFFQCVWSSPKWSLMHDMRQQFNQIRRI